MPPELKSRLRRGRLFRKIKNSRTYLRQ